MSITRSHSQRAPATKPAIAPARVGVLLAGHGSPSRPAAAECLARHAASLRASGRFADVRHAVLEGGPDPALVRSWLDGMDLTLIVPMFMSDGYFTRTALPARLGPSPAAEVLTCPPLGLWSELADLVATIALAARRARGWQDGDWDLLLVAHGSTKDPGSRQATESLADQLVDLTGMARLRTAYLEQAPYLSAEAAKLDKPTVAVGLFAAEGVHAVEDVPKSLAGACAPVVYTGAVGADPRLPELLVKVIEQKLTRIAD